MTEADEREKRGSTAGAGPFPVNHTAPAVTLDAKYVLAALRGAVEWHTEQGRPYSATTDADAITVIEQLLPAASAMLAALEALRNLNFVSAAIVGSGEDAEGKMDGLQSIFEEADAAIAAAKAAGIKGES